MKPSRRQHIVFLGDLQVHAIREVCQGAAEYVAAKSRLDFDPWPVLANEKRPSAFNLSCAHGLIAAAPAAGLIRQISRRGQIPRVYFLTNGEYPRVPCVELDEMAVGQMAAEHLLVRGYRHLAFVGSAAMRWSRARGEGFTRAARMAGVPVRNHEFPIEELPIYWSSQLTTRHARLKGILTELPKPCGVFAANDVIACFLIETARFHGMGVPQPVGVIGVDDDPIPNAAAGLAISSVQVPFREVGRQAARMLDEVRRGKPVPQRLVLPPVRVMVRTSTNAFMVPDPLLRRAQDFIESRRGGRISVGQVVKAVKTTAVTLNHHFVRHLDLTPLEYILQRRMEYARELLRTGEWNVEEVARSCGFGKCSYFCDVFKRVTGTTPGSQRINRIS